MQAPKLPGIKSFNVDITRCYYENVESSQKLALSIFDIHWSLDAYIMKSPVASNFRSTHYYVHT